MSVLTLSNDEYKKFPDICKDYAVYSHGIKGNSEKTVCEYLLDIRTFLRFYLAKKQSLEMSAKSLETISISEIGIDDIRSINQRLIYEFLSFIGANRKNKPSTRMRKLSALKSFFRYLHKKQAIIDFDPTADVDAPKKGSTLPKFLTVEESVRLLEAIKNDNESKTIKRDYAMISIFLNTGMRLSELVGLNLESFDRALTQVTVVGKGNKERLIYINQAARSAIEDYLRVRLDPKHIRTSNKAFFLSQRENRISAKTVQYIVYKYLKLAGLGSRKMSVHKLRHTAATLMYQSGKVDVRVLKDILGHEQLNTTQIYTHVIDRNMEEAVEANPLADIKIK